MLDVIVYVGVGVIILLSLAALTKVLRDKRHLTL
jgi:hypothetical protein